MSWISKLLTQAIVSAPSSLSVEPRIFITSTQAQLPDMKDLDYEVRSDNALDSSSSSVEEKKEEILTYTAFKINKGRPNAHQIIKDAVAESTGPVSVDGEWMNLSTNLG
jgi:hypothetical protein